MKPVRFIFAPLLGALSGACGGPTVTAVAWPELGEEELAFVIETKDGLRQSALGPLLPDGPGVRLQLSDSDDIHLVIVDTRSVASLHPRVDASRWAQLRIVETPTTCSECSSTCRAESNELLYHPLGSLSRTLRLEEGRFEPLGEDAWPSLWLEIPARWTCRDITSETAFERFDDWQGGRVHRGMTVVADDYLLALTDAIRVVGAEPELLLYPPSGSSFRSAAGIVAERVFVTVPTLRLGPGQVFELALGPNRLEVTRQIPIPFPVSQLHVDQMGLVVGGPGGEIATSTDGWSFRYSQIPQEPEVSALSRFGLGDTPFLVGYGSGGVARGNPWKNDPGWTIERVDIHADSTTVQFLQTIHEGSVVLWARTVERGFYLQRDGGPWERLAVEMPNAHPRCRLRTNPCGFGEPPARTRFSDARDGRVFAVADNCSAMLVFDLEQACTSSLTLLENGAPIENPSGLTLLDEHAYVLFPDRVVRTAIAPFF